jgi:hypothetical protein
MDDGLLYAGLAFIVLSLFSRSVAGKLFRADVVIADSGLVDHGVEAFTSSGGTAM